MSKKRLDQLLQERYSNYSRRQIQSWIMQGKVSLQGRILNKPGVAVSEDAAIVLHVEEPKYVSRAGFKLEQALKDFNICVQDLVILDAGISTGGFTDCLLQNGAKKIFGIDVGYGQVHEKIRHDERVVILERTNLRNLFTVGEQVDLVTLDLSFISILKVMDAICKMLKSDGRLITLIKPQFEARKEDVGRGGIIKDPVVHQWVQDNVSQGIMQHGFELVGIIDSPITGSTGNKEFLAYFKRIAA